MVRAGKRLELVKLEVLVPELRRERDDWRSHVVVSKRTGEIVAGPTELVPEGLEELPQWITSTSTRLSMAMEREDLTLVAELSAQLATGGTKLASARRRCNPGSAIAVVNEPAVQIWSARREDRRGVQPTQQ